MFKFLKEKQVKKAFEFKGNRDFMRTEEEKLCIDKQEADLAFKKCKKEFIDCLLLSKGFYKYKTNAYVRLNSIGLLEYIDLQKERYGAKTFCVNFLAVPLYCCDFISPGLGDRLGSYISGKDVWWDYASETVARESFENVAIAIETFIFPWFEQVSTEDGYRKALRKMDNKHLAKDWAKAIGSVTNKEMVIEQKIVELKLPFPTHPL